MANTNMIVFDDLTKNMNKHVSYMPEDIKLLHSPKGISKAKYVLRKSPVDLDLIFQSQIIFRLGKQDNNREIEQLLGSYISCNSDKITFVHSWNTKFPLTGWIMMHRLFHAVWFAKKHGSYEYFLNTFIPTIVKIIHDTKETNVNEPYHWLHKLPNSVENIFTMRSARRNELDNSFDLFSELGAQYMITGSVKLNRIDPCGNFDDTEKLKLHSTIADAETEFNRFFEQLVQKMCGNVFFI